MEKDTRYMHEIADSYRADVEKLSPYIPWLTSKFEKKVSGLYKGEGIEHSSMPIPVYDSQLMALVQEIKNTSLLDKNYVYLYSRNRLKTVEDERNIIDKASIQEMDILKGVLSRYILGGMTNTVLWPKGVENGIYLTVICKLIEIIEFWSGPIKTGSPEE